MKNNLSQLQIRSFVLKTLSDKQDFDCKNEVLKLKHLNQDKIVTKILLKEFFSCKDIEKKNTIFLLIQAFLSKDMLEKEMWKVLESKASTDLNKSNALFALQFIGSKIDYDDVLQLFENPDEFIESDTFKMLEIASKNIEAKVELFDFLFSLNLEERFLLVKSLIEDSKKVELANLLEPLIYLEDDFEMLEMLISFLGDSKSPLAFCALEFVCENKKFDDRLKFLANKAIKKLKFANVKKKFLPMDIEKKLASSVLNKAIVSIPDGIGNVAAIVSRKFEDGSIQMFSCVFNDMRGIVAAFGFEKLSRFEFDKIVKSFVKKKTKFEIEPRFLKKMLEDSMKKNFETGNKIPYEFLCFKHLLFDCQSSGFVINNSDIQLSQENVESILHNEIFEHWFIGEKDNSAFSKCVEEIYETGNLNLYKKFLGEIFNLDFVKILKKRLEVASFILQENKKHLSEPVFQISRGCFFDFFAELVLKQSIYQHFCNLKDEIFMHYLSKSNLVELKKPYKNFDMYDIGKVEKLIVEMERIW